MEVARSKTFTLPWSSTWRAYFEVAGVYMLEPKHMCGQLAVLDIRGTHTEKNSRV
jgi:hypothetical protein